MSSSDSKTKWTPGNWLAAAKPSSIVGWPVVSSPQGRVVASVSFQKIKPPHISEEEMARYRAECEANARLIAAAPQMYAALKDVLRIARAASIGITGNAKRIAAAEAALAKAEGRDV